MNTEQYLKTSYEHKVLHMLMYNYTCACAINMFNVRAY